MSRNQSDRRGHSPLVIVLVLGLIAAAVGLLWFNHVGSQRWDLISQLSQARIGTGRLFRAPSAPFDPERYKKTLAEAELAILLMPESPFLLRLQALVAAGNGRLPLAADILSQLRKSTPNDAEVLNDLGVIYLALGEQDAQNYFKAAQLFEQSRRLAVHAPAPSFNAVLAYRYAELGEQYDAAMREYVATEKNERWIAELLLAPPTDAQLAEQLQFALNRQPASEAIALVRKYAPRYRKTAMNQALNPPDNLDLSALEFVFENSSGPESDELDAAMLAPLKGPDKERFTAVRKLTHSGIEAYLQGQFETSRYWYDLAENQANGADFEFDRLWIVLNLADAQLRSGKAEEARPLLDNVILQARKNQYKWLLGKALSSKGADPVLSGGAEQALQTLNEAIAILSSVGAQRDAARPKYYLAVIHSLAGDFETSLDLCYQSLRMTPEDDLIRRAQSHSVAGLQLYRLGFQRYAVTLEEQAVKRSELAKNPGMTAFFSSWLATVYAATGRFTDAQKYLSGANDLLRSIPFGRDHNLSALPTNLLCARIEAGTGRTMAAERCLNENLEIVSRLVMEPYYRAQTLRQLAEIYLLQRKFDLTRKTLAEAAQVVETNDVFLGADSLRTSFENERRRLYDQAIAFEYDHEGKDAAWTYLQGYQSKLFLEFLRQMNPGVEGIHNDANRREKVQQIIPANTQVVEYVVLPDRLLIWLVSNNTFQSVAVPVTRAELERRIADFLQRVQAKQDISHEASDLYRLLIEPIESQLDPNRSLAIVPDQALHRLNFRALYSASKKAYLIQRYTILDNPSLTSLLSGSKDGPLRANVVAFGAQTDDTDGTMELDHLKKYYSDIQVFNGPDALKPAFLSSMPAAGVLHYAGHSQDASDPLRSSILLDGNREGINSVTAVDIIKRRMLPNSVVVLASCDSSVGNSRDGVGMRGLTSAFLISGAGSVVGSLWPVESKSTSRLVLAFHKSFAKDKLPVAEALRKAQLGFIAEGSHPYYWSGFVVTGNISALQ